jgi:8-oxo-dGTP pyrophosphatase MutT (NUDIX family)
VKVELSRQTITARLAAHRPRDPAFAALSRAGVAAVLRFSPAPEVLLMERAARPGDRWSGHISFPGGRESPGDRDLLATAIRETREEVGLDLEQHGRVLGRLDGVRAVARGMPLSMVIVPHVFVCEACPGIRLELGDEAAGVFWLPLAEAASGRLDDTYRYKLGPASWNLPCWRYHGHTIWGLTYQMLSQLLAIATSP